MAMKKMIQKQLGELLLQAKLISQEHLDKALKIQSEKGGLIGEILVSIGCTTEDTIAQALTAQYGFPYIPLGGYAIDAEVAKLIPHDVCKQYMLIAVDKVGSVLTLAMSNPLNQAAINEIEKITNFKVQVFVSTTTDIQSAIKSCYGTS